MPLLLYLSTKPKYRRSIPARFFPFLRVFTLESSGFCKDFYPHFWLHACSFGEIKSLEPIIQALAQAAPTRNILLTTTTQTGFDLAQSSYASEPRIRVEFLPFEIFLPFYAHRLKQLQALVVTEAELWLGAFHTAKTLGAKTLLINARISTRSYPKYRRFRFFYRVLFSCVDEVFSQTQADSTRLAELGARHIEVLGNLKLLSPIHISRTYPKPQNRLVIVAASTHKGEEELVLQAFSTLKKLESSKVDSALGRQCGSVAGFLKKHRLSASGIPCFVKGTTAKVANLPQNPQSSHSPTATPRILEKDNRASCENATPESTFENATNLNASAQDSRICDEKTSEALGDSRCFFSKSALSNDWQGSYLEGNDRRQSRRIADLSRKTSEAVQGEAAAGFFSKAESTKSAAKPTPKTQNEDSRISKEAVLCDEKATILSDSQAAGFADDFLKKPAAAAPCTAIAGFGGFQGVGEGIYLGDNEQAHRADSRKSAAKPTPKTQKVDSSPSPSDSKIVELELGLFEPRKEIRLGGLSTQCGDEIHDSSPKAESPKTQKVDSSLLILAPRHPERFTQVASLLASYPFASARFSHDPNALTNPSLDVVLLDTLGELNNCYAIADIVILGGAFIPAGGHNPLEPAFFGTKLISGRAIFNQEALFACVDGYTLCEASELESTLLAHQSLPHTSYKHTQASLSTLIQAITTHKD